MPNSSIEPTDVAMRLAKVAYTTCQEWLTGVNQPDSVHDRIALALDEAGVREAVEHITDVRDKPNNPMGWRTAKLRAALAALRGESHE